MVEDLTVRRAEEQHGSGPLVSEVGQHGLAAAGGGLVHGKTVGQGAVELPRESGCRPVGDGELHGHDRGAVLLDQALRHPAERVGGIDASGVTSVEQDQPQRVVVAQIWAQDRGADPAAAPVAVGEAQDTVADPVVELTVTDEVQDVHLVPTQPRGQGRDRRCGEPVDPHPARGDLARESVLNPPPLGLHVELR